MGISRYEKRDEALVREVQVGEESQLPRGCLHLPDLQQCRGCLSQYRDACLQGVRRDDHTDFRIKSRRDVGLSEGALPRRLEQVRGLLLRR